MTAIAKSCDDTRLEKKNEADSEYFEAVERLRRHKSSVTKDATQKVKALDLPEISGNLSRRKSRFF